MAATLHIKNDNVWLLKHQIIITLESQQIQKHNVMASYCSAVLLLGLTDLDKYRLPQVRILGKGYTDGPRYSRTYLSVNSLIHIDKIGQK